MNTIEEILNTNTKINIICLSSKFIFKDIYVDKKMYDEMIKRKLDNFKKNTSNIYTKKETEYIEKNLNVICEKCRKCVSENLPYDYFLNQIISMINKKEDVDLMMVAIPIYNILKYENVYSKIDTDLVKKYEFEDVLKSNLIKYELDIHDDNIRINYYLKKNKDIENYILENKEQISRIYFENIRLFNDNKLVYETETNQQLRSIMGGYESINYIKKHSNTISMKEIIEKYKDSDYFSLSESINFTSHAKGNFSNLNMTKEEYLNAIDKLEKEIKKEFKEKFEKKHLSTKYGEFNKKYDKIKKECIDFSKSNIYDKIKKSTEYDDEDKSFFQHLYIEIVELLRKSDFSNIIFKKEEDIRDRLPKNLKDSLIRYEYSFSNKVNRGSLYINYYFKLTENSIKYLLMFDDDFELDLLKDLTFYKNNEALFYSCTHEEYNSLKINVNNE